MASQRLVVDKEKIKKAILSGIPLTVTTFTLPHEIEIYIEDVITVFLNFVGQSRLRDYIVYCVQELAVNAKKANTKRVYFAEMGMNLSDPDDYKMGMIGFKEITLNNIAHYLQIQKEKGLYIKLIIQVKKNIIHLEVRNNVSVTRTELIRIHDKLARSRQYESLDEALSQVLDDSEGAGLGLVILVLMLKKMGLDEDCFDIFSTDKETVARMLIPLDQAHVENLSVLSQSIVNNVNSLPQFPENILQAQRLVNDPEANMGAIARQMSMDPGLTGDLLKIVNSAQFMLIKRVDSIAEAVRLVGIRGIKNLLYSYGTMKILGDDTAEKKHLWEHCYQSAFYAYNLVKNFKHDRNLMDDVYVGGILHDMGKIVFSNVHPELLEKIQRFCVEKNIPASTFEDLSAGMNHAEIGALIAEKWNFPDALVNVIRYHHDPASAPESARDLVDTVYLANMMCHYENGTVSYDQIDPAPLANYGIKSKSQIDVLMVRFASGFKKEMGGRTGS